MACCGWHTARKDQGLAWSHAMSPKPAFAGLETPTVPGRRVFPMTSTWVASAEGLPSAAVASPFLAFPALIMKSLCHCGPVTIPTLCEPVHLTRP